MGKIKAFLNRKKTAVMVACFTALCCVSAFAAEDVSGGSMAEITTALQTGFTQVAADIIKVIAIAVVAVIGVVGVKVSVKGAIKFFKSMASGS